MNITTRVKDKWIKLSIQDGSTTIEVDLWKEELNEVKDQLEEALYDVNFMIDKLSKQQDND
jgi:DNA polymerase III alpha subunit